MRPRSFTIEQVDACVPRLRVLLERLQRGALQLEDARHRLARDTGGDPHDVPTEPLLTAYPALRRVVEDVAGALEEIHDLGAELKDVDLGLVDFPAQLGGEAVYLCWQFGEDRVRYWHRRTEGFAGRRPLPGLPPPPEPQ